DHAAFQGTFTPQGFKITRIIHHRNSFLPVILGEIVRGPLVTTVHVKMRLHRFVAGFTAFWFVGVLCGIGAVLATIFSHRPQLSPMLLIPVGMLVFGTVLVSASFWFEAKKQKPLLIQMFNGRERSASVN